MFRALMLSCALALPTLASATTGLEWKWEEGVKHRYAIDSQVQLSQVFWFLAQDNKERRILQWQVNLDTTCQGIGMLGKKAYNVECSIDQIAMAVLPNKGDEKDTVALLDEYTEKMTGAKVRMKFALDGRILTFDLDGVKHNRSNDRTRRIQESLRLVVQRAFVGLDLQLPKGGDDKDKGWNAKDPLLMSFPTLKGTTGGLEWRTEVKAEKAGRVKLEGSGTGTRGPAIFGPNDQIANLWEMRGGTAALFDTELGVLRRQEAISEGTITPSSQLATGATVPPYIQAVVAERVEPDAKIELPPNRLITPE